MRKRIRRVILFGIAGLIVLGAALVGLSALSNRSLPTHSQATDRLSALEKARLAEAIHLRQALGDVVWPGWGQLHVPIIVYNEEYAFLVDYPSPPAGWVKMPQQQARGGPWESVPDDVFEGQPYYRQQLPDPDITPEDFTVLVGESWVATMQTREHMEVAFYAGMREQLPPLLSPVFPYRLVWRLLMGETDSYISGLEHEAFHALQGSVAPARLAEAEIVNKAESEYPWTNPTLVAWERELDLLVRAVRAQSNEVAAERVRQFLQQRDARRATAGLRPDLVDYERQREWLEGLAKYAELSLGRLAGATPGYIPVPELAADPDFRRYATRERFWSQQIDEVRRTSGREGRTLFYYSGMAQAVLLDRLMPAWKEHALESGIMLEDLLREATRQ